MFKQQERIYNLTMGMFDTLSISDTLPYTQEMKDLGLDKNDHNWQTKDLDNCMNLYYIQGGRLSLQRYKKSEWVKGDPKAKSVMDRIGYLNQEDPYLDPVNFHGEIYFYDFKQDVEDKWDCWIEFKAIFTNGIVDRYELVKFEKTDNAERKQRDKEWKEQMIKDSNKWINKYFFYTKPVRWFGRKVWYRTCTAISNFFNKLAFKL